MPKPLLSIGIIFKNEIRCLERCLKSLTPLREAVPCELVMADTGSDDGSRAVAEKYADILIDFPWINDFAAARNSVIERCTGRWLFVLDADEWLDGDIGELVSFVRSNNQKGLEGCLVCIRNYSEKDDFSLYSDFHTMRIIRMSTGAHFVGAIHEQLRNAKETIYTNIKPLRRTILHHDGYINLNQEDGKAKRLRNQILLEKRLEQDPENVRLLLQYIETSRPDPQHMEYLHRGLAVVEAKKEEWDILGPVIYRYAVLAAHEKDLPEEEEWITRAEELFPESFYTRIDIAYLAFGKYWAEENWSKCIYWGERYLAALEDYDAGRGDQIAERVSTLLSAAPKWRRKLSEYLAAAYRKNSQPGRALELLKKIDPLEGNLVGETLKNLQELQVSTNQDTAPDMLHLYDRITGEKDEKLAKELMKSFLQTAPLAFGPDVREQEKAREDFCRYSYTVYLPLAGRCEAGTAAAVMETEDVQKLDELLGTVKKWGDFSVSALIWALEKGASFPPDNMRMEEMDHIAKRLAQYRGRFYDVACQTAPPLCTGTWRQLTWARSMVFAAVQAFSWQDEKQGLALAETFVKVVGTFVSRCYTSEMLCEENIQVLPSLHRFGWYSSRAFQVLEAGDAAGYVRLLRAGLETCPEMKTMVEFLTKHTPQLKPSPSQELLELADKVRTLLAAYDPADPAVAALKQSPVYQKVAYLIEGIDARAMGGFAQ